MQKTSSRLLALLSLLQARPEWSGDDLAERLEVTVRTVRRDIDRLRALGYPVATDKGPGGGYRLRPGSQMPPLLFDDEQVIALAVALQSTAHPAIAEDADRALATIRNVLPPRLRQRIDALHVTTVRPPDPGTPPAQALDLLATVSTAIQRREVLRLDYTPHQEAAPQRRCVEPHHLVAWRTHWYLLAWDLDRDDWRTFRTDRMTPRTPTGPRFTVRQVPGGDVFTFVTSRFRGSDGTDAAWPCQGEAIVDLPASEVVPYTADGIVEPLGPTRCRVITGSWSWTALAASLGRFDANLHVIGPPALHEACATLARRYAAATAGAARQAESGDDGVQVLAKTGDEAVQGWQVVFSDTLDP
ncbi:transcriptional regulator [Streptomyces cinnabarinus]|uniref:Transcriptional regulator n=1 Tax=Streptomyces cinnabarinus TaxID=67287 RepID=A0ABY7KQC9_9ACTN|nr:transcriptional regulator [Streptomyces cinnabarinus]WAZ26773.1 transcriptional regulator [Streptomyces cinnabarinus]